jgi:Family of unknown function (DUF6599)
MGRKLLTLSALTTLMLAYAAAQARDSAQSRQEKPSVITLVPAPDWRMVSSQDADATSLAAWGGDPAIEHEYGVSAYTSRSYEYEDHAARALLEQASDPSAAYGLMTFYRADGMKPAEGMPVSLMGGGKALLARGPVFIRVFVDKPETMTEFLWRRLLIAVGGPPPSAHALEQLPQPLPSRGLVRGTEQYSLGPLAAHKALPEFPAELLGFQEGAEVQTAEYSAGRDGRLTLASIDYPTPQLARDGLKTLTSALAKYTPNQGPPFECRRQDAYVLVVMNAPSRAAAAHFLDGFRVTKEVERDEASQGPSDVWEVVQLLVANGILIIFLVIASLLGGVIICVGKRLARKWFADSLFVEGEGGGIIVLNLR